jgi:excisionase family DNA binding protein
MSPGLLPSRYDVEADSEQQQWFTVEQAARYLQVGKGAIYKWVRQGLVDYYELPSGRGRRFRREDLDRLLQRRGGVPPPPNHTSDQRSGPEPPAD